MKLDTLLETEPFDQIEEARPATIVSMTIWFRVPKYEAATVIGNAWYWLDDAGRVLNGHWQGCTHVLPDGRAIQVPVIWVMHTFARLNCHNVKLIPMKSQATGRTQKKGPPSSVWHEIVVDNTAYQKLSKSAQNAAEDRRELRFHRVRGHYADYTNGSGLFGKHKVRIWVEEHGRGDVELGTVVSNFTVQ